jgi:hypothetical protein
MLANVIIIFLLGAGAILMWNGFNGIFQEGSNPWYALYAGLIGLLFIIAGFASCILLPILVAFFN